MANGFSSYGTKLEIGSSPTEVKYTTKVDVDIGTVDDIDLTNNNSPDATEETCPGIIRTGVIDIEGNFEPTDPGQAALIAALQARTRELNFTVTCADTGLATWTGHCHVKAFKNPNPATGKSGFTAQLKGEGKFTLTP